MLNLWGHLKETNKVPKSANEQRKFKGDMKFGTLFERFDIKTYNEWFDKTNVNFILVLNIVSLHVLQNSQMKPADL